MNEWEALKILEEGDEEAAQVALTWLLEQHREFINRYAWRWLFRTEDREDVAQEVYLKLWKARPQFKNQGGQAWRGMLKVTTLRACVDLLRRTAREITTEDGGNPEPPDNVLAEADELVAHLVRSAVGQRLIHQADALWLGLDPAQSPQDRTRQLLAAKLFYVEGHPIPHILRRLSATPTQPTLTRERLEAWLAGVGVLRYLAYEALYYSSEALVAVLLEQAMPPELRRLESLGLQARSQPVGETPPGGWNWEEVLVVLARYYRGLTVEQIFSRRDCRNTREELNEITERSRMRFPFKREMADLLRCLEESPGLPIKEAFVKQPGLWQRLAFQYWYADQLSQLDILERIHPPAEVVEASVNATTINAWLSGGRLRKRLLDACEQREVTHED